MGSPSGRRFGGLGGDPRRLAADSGRVAGSSDHDRSVPRVLLLLPTATYRAPDFVAAARALGAEVVVASEQRQAMADAMDDRAVVVPLGDVEAGVAAVVELPPARAASTPSSPSTTGRRGRGTRRGRGSACPTIRPTAVAATRDKAAMRRALAAARRPPARASRSRARPAT